MKTVAFRAIGIACVMTMGVLATGTTAAHAQTRTRLYSRAARYSRSGYSNFSGATGDSFTDPDDTTGPLDIASASRSGDATTLTLLITTYDAFTDQDALFDVVLDTNGDNKVDHEVIAGWDGSKLTAEVSHGTPHTFAATVTRPDTKSIQISLSRSLINGSTTFSWAALSIFLPLPKSAIVPSSYPTSTRV